MVEPGVWPGACNAVKSTPAIDTSAPSVSSRTSSGSTKVVPGASRCTSSKVSGPIAAYGSASRFRSAG